MSKGMQLLAAALHEVGYFLISSYLLGTDSNVHLSKRKEASYFPYALVKQKIKHHRPGQEMTVSLISCPIRTPTDPSQVLLSQTRPDRERSAHMAGGPPLPYAT
jgi:hypothetical protein